MSLFSRAQYFGRNKVVYEKFDFHVIHTAHFNIYYYPPEDKIIDDISQMAERWYERYSLLLNHTFTRRQPIILYANDADFRQTEVVPDIIQVGVGGFTEYMKQRLVIPVSKSYSETDHVLGHEIAHVFQLSMLGSSDSTSSFKMSMIPLWITEGMAEYLSLGPEDEFTAMYMRDAVINHNIPSIPQMSSKPGRYFPYRFGHAMWAFIGGTWGDSIISKVFMSVGDAGWKRGIPAALGISLDSLDALWQQSLMQYYMPQVDSSWKEKQKAEKIFSLPEKMGRMNLSPVISPDGKYAAFLTQKNIFTIDLFLADANSGKLVRKIGSSNANRNYEALNFIHSAGSWSPDSRNFVFTAFSGGTVKLIIVNALSGKIVRSKIFDSVGEILNPAWSPDGNAIVFSGTNGGMTDLYLWKLDSDELKQLTDDPYADMQPQWSPDGNSIVFVTDRGSDCYPARLRYGKMKIGIYKMNGGIDLLPEMDSASEYINPIFSADGNSIYLIADPEGISNIYRYQFDNQKFYRVSFFTTGVCGITPLSPAMSISGNTNSLVFSVFNKSGYEIYKLKIDSASKEYIRRPNVSFRLLPPVQKKDAKVYSYLKPLPEVIKEEKKYKAEKYVPRLALDKIGGLFVGVTGNQYGTGAAAGGLFRFSDLLEHHALYVLGQVGIRATDFAGEILYINKTNRFNWGGVFSHFPSISSSLNSYYDSVNSEGQKVYAHIFDEHIQTTYQEDAALIGRYPVSMTNRVEMVLGEEWVSYKTILNRRTYLPDGSQLSDETFDASSPPDYHFTFLSTAYVGDNSFFGVTDPLEGYRYRFQLDNNFGTYNFTGLTLDYRKYYRLSPFSAAFRLMHLGRYGGDAENQYLAPLFLGNQYLIRGYEANSFEQSEQTGTDRTSFPVYDRLLGSRLAAANVELRFPLSGPRVLSLIKSDIIYTSLNLFTDAGIAWWQNDKPVFELTQRSDKRIPVFSSGIAARWNIFGILVLEYYWAYPFQRPDKGFHSGISLLYEGW